MSSSPSDGADAGVPAHGDRVAATVVIATYARPALIARLLGQLAAQHVSPGTFEVVVVDDGSPEPLVPEIAAVALPYRLTLLRQQNAGPAAARRRAIAAARGELIIVIDDDMQIGTDFVAAHLRAHADGARRVVLGRIRHDGNARGSLMQRYHMAKLARAAERSRSGRALSGVDVYTGNVSFRHEDYVAAGGFDPSFRVLEDADLGLRLERHGATVLLSEEAASLHTLAPSSLAEWMPYAVANGHAAARVGAKQPDVDAANPWRYLFLVNRVSRPLLLASALMPRVGRGASWAVMAVARGIDAIGAERAAIAATTLVYGLRFMAGVREEEGSLGRSMRGLARHLNAADPRSVGWAGKIGKLGADILADHDALREQDARYRGRMHSTWTLPWDALRNVGFQMMIAYRVMRYLRWVHLTPLAMIQSRLMRHAYAADIHWDADLRPGVTIVHGIGVAISGETRIGSGSVICHHVSIGVNTDPLTGEGGSPHLEENVHVGPGAVIVGPLTVGAGTKIMANSVLMRSVPPRSLVAPAEAVIRERRPGRKPAREVATTAERSQASAEAEARVHA